MSPAAAITLQMINGVVGHRPIRSRSGLTLIELLVAVFILLLITAIAIPVINPSLESRRLNETSRLVTGYFQGARTRAIQEQRPVGVWLEPMAGNAGACNTLFYAHVPPPYAGDSVGATVTISGTGTTRTVTGSFDTSLVQENDWIRFNYQGHLYKITTPAPTATALTITLSGSTSTNFPPNSTGGLPAYAFQVYRRPIKLPGAPLTLPEGRVIDLSIPKTDITAGLPAAASGPYVVLFTPGGAVSGFFYGGASGSSIAVTSPVFLLIGKAEKVGIASPDTNYEDLENLWMGIHPQTGLVTRAEVAAGGSGNCTQSQSIVQTGLSMGGR